MAIATLINLRAPRRNDVRRVEAAIHRIRLARVDHEQHLAVPPLLPHLLEGVRQVPAPDLLAVLELEELVAAVPGHVDQQVAAAVAAEALAARDLLGQAVGQQPDEGLDRDLVAAVVDLDVVAVEVERPVRVVVDGAGEGVARVAGHVVGQHEDDLRVRDAEPFDAAVQGEHVGEVPVVEPEARGGHQHGPVGGVLRRGEEGEKGEGEEGQEGELHGGGGRWRECYCSERASAAEVRQINTPLKWVSS